MKTLNGLNFEYTFVHRANVRLLYRAWTLQANVEYTVGCVSDLVNALDTSGLVVYQHQFQQAAIAVAQAFKANPFVRTLAAAEDLARVVSGMMPAHLHKLMDTLSDYDGPYYDIWLSMVCLDAGWGEQEAAGRGLIRAGRMDLLLEGPKA